MPLTGGFCTMNRYGPMLACPRRAGVKHYKAARDEHQKSGHLPRHRRSLRYRRSFPAVTQIQQFHWMHHRDTATELLELCLQLE